MEVVKASFAGALDQLKVDPRFVVSRNRYFTTVALWSFFVQRNG